MAGLYTRLSAVTSRRPTLAHHSCPRLRGAGSRRRGTLALLPRRDPRGRVRRGSGPHRAPLGARFLTALADGGADPGFLDACWSPPGGPPRQSCRRRARAPPACSGRYHRTESHLSPPTGGLLTVGGASRAGDQCGASPPTGLGLGAALAARHAPAFRTALRVGPGRPANKRGAARLPSPRDTARRRRGDLAPMGPAQRSSSSRRPKPRSDDARAAPTQQRARERAVPRPGSPER